MRGLKNFMYRSLLNNTLGKLILNTNFKARFSTSEEYWEKRYRNNGTSGPGSYGELALYKSRIINKFVADNNISKVIEFGCGDGNQLQQFKFPSYIGLDVSDSAIEKCTLLFADDLSKSFLQSGDRSFVDILNAFGAELALSLDVVYHLLEDAVFEMYMSDLFLYSAKFVIIYAWDVESPVNLHIKHRKFTKWINNNVQGWLLIQTIKNETSYAACDFYIYRRQ